MESWAVLRSTLGAASTIFLASLLLGGCLGKSVPSNHDILKAIQMAMDEDARSMFKVTRVKRLNGYSAGGQVYRLDCNYDLKLMRQMPKRMGDFQNQMNNMSE